MKLEALGGRLQEHVAAVNSSSGRGKFNDEETLAINCVVAPSATRAVLSIKGDALVKPRIFFASGALVQVYRVRPEHLVLGVCGNPQTLHCIKKKNRTPC